MQSAVATFSECHKKYWLAPSERRVLKGRHVSTSSEKWRRCGTRFLGLRVCNRRGTLCDSSRSIMRDMSSSRGVGDSATLAKRRGEKRTSVCVRARVCVVGRVGRVGRVGHDDSSWIYSPGSYRQEKDSFQCYECSFMKLLTLLGRLIASGFASWRIKCIVVASTNTATLSDAARAKLRVLLQILLSED